MTEINTWDGRTIKIGDKVRYKDFRLSVLDRFRDGVVIGLVSANIVQVKWPQVANPASEFTGNIEVC